MEYSKWVVGVISTDYDLKEERKKIIEMLDKLGFRVSAFERPDFPIEPNRHSHDVCLDAIDRLDIVVLIVNKRYGGFYVGNDLRLSITEEEFIKAVDQKKLIVTCVAEETWNEKEKYNNELKAYSKHLGKGSKISKKTEAAFASNYHCIHVDKPQTIQFINRIRKMKINNYLCFYSNLIDLCEIVREKISGFSRYICELIVRKQCDKVKATSETIGTEFGIEELLKNNQYYVDPIYEIVSGEMHDEIDICKPISSEINQDRRTLIIGNAGSGKSVLVSKMFLSKANTFLKNRKDIYKIPFFISLRNKGADYHFSISGYIEDCINEYLEKEAFPLFNVADLKPLFYIDGFDELCDDIAEERIDAISKTSIIKASCIVSSRIPFSRKYLETPRFQTKFHNVIKLLPWNKEVAKAYIVKFCSKSKMTTNEIVENVINKEEFVNIYTNPLLLTILLWLLQESEICLPLKIHDQAFLLKKCLMYLVSRELARDSIDTQKADLVLNDWAYVAWKIYSNRNNSNEICLSNICDMAVDDGYSIGNLYKPELVFDINQVTKVIKGTYHEQFLEYLTALAIIEGCLRNKYPYPGFLYIIIRPEINAMIDMEYCSRNRDDKEVIYKKFFDQYVEGIANDNIHNALKRIQALYHVSKLDAVNSSNYLFMALKSETSIVIRPSLMFNAVKKGDLNIEEKFISELKASSELSEHNRGFHLAYYGDRIYNEMPYLDDNIDIKWTNTYGALLRHFERTENQYYYIRRIDLYMIYDFMSTRNSVDPVKKEDLERIKTIIEHPGINREFDVKVKKEFEEVMDLFMKLNEKK